MRHLTPIPGLHTQHATSILKVFSQNSKIRVQFLDRISDVAFDGNTCKTSASGSVNSTGLEPELLTRFELSSSGSTGDVIILNLNFLRLQNSAVKIFFVYFAKVLLLAQ